MIYFNCFFFWLFFFMFYYSFYSCFFVFFFYYYYYVFYYLPYLQLNIFTYLHAKITFALPFQVSEECVFGLGPDLRWKRSSRKRLMLLALRAFLTCTGTFYLGYVSFFLCHHFKGSAFLIILGSLK